MIGPREIDAIVDIAMSLIPGAAGVPWAGPLARAVAMLVTRLVSGESLDDLRADPLKRASGVDSEALRREILGQV
jgi:hypothetical protein